MPSAFNVPIGPESTVSARLYEAAEPAIPALLVLAHGAGAGHDHPFMTASARGLTARGLTTVTFNFPYMERRAKVPNPAPQLEACYRAVIAALRERGALEGRALFIGGKSMGGRMASHLAAAPDTVGAPLAGLVCLGYPLHPPGKPDALRAAHLAAIRTPVLIVQGERDAFGTPAELAPILGGIPASVEVETIEKGDHSFKVSGLSGDAQAARIEAILDRVSGWVRTHAAR